MWNSIIKAVVLGGFELEKIVYQPPARPSAKGLLQPYGSAVGDYYIRFRKPETEKRRSEQDIDKETYEREVVWAAKEIIEERGEPTIYQRILNSIMVTLKGGRNVPVGARNIEDVLKDHVGKEFEFIDVKDAKGKKAGKMWWLKGRDATCGPLVNLQMIEKDDWRLRNQACWLAGSRAAHGHFRQTAEDFDHAHCEFVGPSSWIRNIGPFTVTRPQQMS